MSVPTIDLSGGPAGVAGEVRGACEGVGFLTILAGKYVLSRAAEAGL